MDIEGNERILLKRWLETGEMSLIRQIALEWHSVELYLEEYEAIMVGLHELGFRILMWEPNFMKVEEDGFYRNFEILLRRVETACNLEW